MKISPKKCRFCGKSFTNVKSTRQETCNTCMRSFKGLQGRDVVREMVRKRDGRKCTDCSLKWKRGQRRFDVHHLNGMCGKKSRGYDQSTKGLTTLCHSCHIGRHVKKSKLRGWKYSKPFIKKIMDSDIKSPTKLSKKFGITYASAYYRLHGKNK